MEASNKPCFAPLVFDETHNFHNRNPLIKVWTTNDADGSNQPDLDELEKACDRVSRFLDHWLLMMIIIIAMMINDQVPGCSVHCTPGPSERCIKYTEFSASKLSYTSRCFMLVLVITVNRRKQIILLPLITFLSQLLWPDNS